MEEKDVISITRLVVAALLEEQGRKPAGIPVGVSARHVHLTREHVEQLFGPGHRLTRKKELMGGQFACEETVTLVSPALKVMEKVRVLGPVRGASQVELSATDATKLGLRAPLRDSGDTAGSAGVTLLGPGGAVTLPEGCIVAARHVHMSPDDARLYGVQDGDFLSVRFEGERSSVFERVKVRVSPSFTLEMHIDTDEANAARVNTGDLAVLAE